MALEQPPRIELRGISKHFGSGTARVDALVDIELDVRAGEIVGLLGPSGSGKSTLLNVVGCIAEPSVGWMRLDGEPVYDGAWLRRDLRRLRLEKIGFIFQFHNLLPFLNSTDNVVEAMELFGTPARVARGRTAALLDYLDVGHRRHAMPGQLSGGEAQRVSIARALANSPRIILADEPTAALDSQRAAVVMDLLRRVAADHAAAVLVVTHDEKIFGHFDRLIRLRDGRIEAEELVRRTEIDHPSSALPASGSAKE
jgi:putative ABC transport system ATP-binding protein